VVRPLVQRCGFGSYSSVALEHLDLQPAEIFDRKRHGVFVEAGANDGECQSNTYYFEKVLGWKGLLVEPIPELARICEKRRPDSTVINAALVRSDYPHATVTLERAGLMSIVNDGVLGDATVDHHVQMGIDVQQLSRQEPVTVPAKTLGSLLADHQINHVDFLSLDVEGYELEVLNGIAFNNVTINWILVEVRDSNEAEIEKLLNFHGYRWERIWRTREYANKLYQKTDPGF